ncbi:18S pre-ribosomal assembly protein gar2-related [Striga asiatica]|uniref:18S pre-ribosomal assembly protein gar2-related n=1 Tax=Striga asiatica TaxID=4170 RepID=A0A5A7Q5R5_STRAF|nr:18S pre-ribosomal assembly protein gar2-related [Striga asiatica]
MLCPVLKREKEGLFGFYCGFLKREEGLSKVFHPNSEQDSAMKEDLNSTIGDSKLTFEVNGNYESWNSKLTDEFPTDNQNEPRNSTVNEYQKGPFYLPSCPNEDAESSSSSCSNENLTSSEDSPISNQNEVKDSVLTEPDTFIDKKVLETNFHAVKDICVDEGVKKSSKVGEKNPFESTKEANNGMEIFSSHESANSSSLDCTDEITGDELGRAKLSSESYPANDLTSSVGTDKTVSDCLDGEGNKAERLLPDQVVARERDAQTNSLSYNNKVESKIITFDFDPKLPGTAGESNGKSRNAIIHEDGNFRGFGSSVAKVNDSEPVLDRGKYEHDESSFANADFAPHSGPIPFSGSVSFRSDGSAASERSFAFPILQSEWNSSPVRMTKADRRHLRKHKFWRPSLLCFLLIMLPTCASDQVAVQISIGQHGDSAVENAKSTKTLLPRKLKVQQDTSLNDKDNIVPGKKLMEASSENKLEAENEEKVVHKYEATSKGEWVDGPNKSEYYTMDYNWLKRRRPIHNKHIPLDHSIP